MSTSDSGSGNGSGSGSGSATTTPIVNAHLVDVDDLKKAGVAVADDSSNMQTPTTEHTYSVLDNDAKTCRTADETEFKSSYVDYNISTFRLQDASPFEETLDNENLIITYSGGTTATIRFGLISTDNSPLPAGEFAKDNGLIYPIDDSGDLQLNATNTPVLAATRQWVLDQWTAAGTENVKMAELVNEFVHAGFDPVSSLGEFGG